MAKLVSRPYEEEAKRPQPAPPTGTETAPGSISAVGVLLILLLFAGAVYLVFGAFSATRPPR